MSWGMIATIGVAIVALAFANAFRLVRRADYHASMAGIWALLAVVNSVGGEIPAAVLDAGLAAWDAWRWWKHRNDDDNHHGKRLGAWARSKLPKPAAKTVRSPRMRRDRLTQHPQHLVQVRRIPQVILCASAKKPVPAHLLRRGELLALFLQFGVHHPLAG